MAIKTKQLDGIGEVTFQKRRGSRSLRLHIQGSKVKVTLPPSVPYLYAEQFVLAKKDWIVKNRSDQMIITDGSYIGKSNQVKVLTGSSLRTRVDDRYISIWLPAGVSIDNQNVQEKLRLACEKALRQQTETLIIPRLKDLAYEHGYKVKSLSVKKLRSRWGSCDRQKNIIISLYLAQLPWELIDYVLLHELVHTNHLNHSPAFWQEVESLVHNSKDLRKQMKNYSPHSIRTMA